MPEFVFWNTYRLGGGSGSNKKIIIEGVLAQLFHDHPNIEFAALCEVTSDVQLGDAPVGKNLYRATKKGKGQLAYDAFDTDLNSLDLENADIDDFQDVFGSKSYKKGGQKFSKHSKRPIAYVGQYGGRHVYIYHANASAKSSFVVSWAAESIRQDAANAFVLAGDLNCEPPAFNSAIDLATGAPGYHANFTTPNNGNTHNAKTGLTKTYDWAVAGSAGGAVGVTKFDFSGVINTMGFQDDPRSDHLPIVVAW